VVALEVTARVAGHLDRKAVGQALALAEAGLEAFPGEEVFGGEEEAAEQEQEKDAKKKESKKAKRASMVLRQSAMGTLRNPGEAVEDDDMGCVGTEADDMEVGTNPICAACQIRFAGRDHPAYLREGAALPLPPAGAARPHGRRHLRQPQQVCHKYDLYS
jgi:hypothetical protein